MAPLDRLSRGIRLIENGAVSLLLCCICVLVGLQVLFRFVLRLPLSWSEEVSTYSFVWLALLGSAVGVRERAHIGVDAFIRLVPPPLRRLIHIGTVILLHLFLLALLYQGVVLLYRIGDQRSGALGIPMFWVYLALPINAGLMLIHTIPEFRRALDYVSDSAKE